MVSSSSSIYHAAVDRKVAKTMCFGKNTGRQWSFRSNNHQQASYASAISNYKDFLEKSKTFRLLQVVSMSSPKTERYVGIFSTYRHYFIQNIHMTLVIMTLIKGQGCE